MHETKKKSAALAQFLYWTVAGTYWLLFGVLIVVGVVGVTQWRHPAAFNLESGSLNILFDDPSRMAFPYWTNTLLVLAILALWLVVLRCLGDILREVCRDNVFDARTPRRVRLIGGSVIVASILEAIFAASWGPVVIQSLRADAGIHIVGRADGSQVFLGLVLFALAEVFQRGVDLKAENDLTV